MEQTKIGVREDFLAYHELLNRWKGRVSERALIDMVNRREIIAYDFYTPFGVSYEDGSGINLSSNSIVNMRPHTDELILVDNTENPLISVKNSKGKLVVYEGLYDCYGNENYGTIFFEKKVIAEVERRNPQFLAENALPLPEERINKLEAENAELRARVEELEKFQKSMQKEGSRSEWRNEYPMLAKTVEMVESGLSRKELCSWLRIYNLPVKEIGFLIKNDTDIVQSDTLRQNVYRLEKK